ncbi:ABC-three component system protein [Streptomyces sp. NPDC057199]|uniref:ABC-three component system protein n=1 Tax=Streptomyces sp. NPDC057199 TaxID=3346047 RepID=UPI003644668B
MARVEAPAGQQKVVIQRSGNICAYPSCKAELVVSARHADDRDKAVGKVAHICAASEGGPRFDPDMSDEERGKASNLIYLCGTHHDAIDSQLNHHTVEFLREAKAKHELAVARGVPYSMGAVGFEELESVCNYLTINNDETSSPEEIALDITLEEKIVLNRLTDVSREMINAGIAKVTEVRGFIRFVEDTKHPGFGTKLAAKFKAEYYKAVGQGLEGDEVFSYLCEVSCENSGPRDTPVLRAAAIATVTYLFEICEIFEHVEHSAA